MTREEQKIEDTWNLEAIFKDKKAFDAALKKARGYEKKIKAYKGKITTKEALVEVLTLYDELGIIFEKLGSYAYMKTSEDGSSEANMALMSTYIQASTKISASISFLTPEITKIDSDKITSWLKDKELKDHRIFLKRLLRSKKYVLSENEEKLLSNESNVGGVFSRAFDDLTDVDFDFGEINGTPLTHATYSAFLQNDDIKVREKAYYQYYKKYDENKHLISKLYEGAIRQSLFKTEARGYKSTLERALFEDNISIDVFKNLIDAAHSGRSVLERYYALKRKVLNQDKLYHYDVYMPLVKTYKTHTTYDEAVSLVIKALSPLGKEYTNVLKKGLTTERWVDRYENKGKASGAYSNGSYKTLPYILMSYKEDVLRDVFTLAHEGGHSMHSYYSARNNPYSSYNYTIFEAEVASTFNENLLFKYLIGHSKDDDEKYYLLSKQADDIIATFFRQTMFAEFEYKVHSALQRGDAITLEFFLNTYSELLHQYLPGVELDNTSSLECLRIPHFYRPFYVWKYATGISAAVALSERVINGSDKERNDYLGFLKSGGSHFPLDSLKKAGVDLKNKESFTNIVKMFDNIVSELEKHFH